MPYRSGPPGARGIKTICPAPDNRWRYPLRRVVVTGPIETLECGHTQVRNSDLIGPTFCERRRCGDCWRALPAAERAAKIAAYERRKEQQRARQVAEMHAESQRRAAQVTTPTPRQE